MKRQVGQTYVSSRFRATRPRARVFARGGVVKTAGLYYVGERGPEIVILPPGTNVIPAR